MKKILVVDDAKEFVETIADYLEENGFICTKVYSAEEAIMELGRDNFDIIITDWNMPENNGLFLLKYVRDNEHFKSLPVILMASTDQGKDWENLGFNGYLPKPVGRFAIIVEMINKLL
jgi:CheY-like chemotaxis protein